MRVNMKNEEKFKLLPEDEFLLLGSRTNINLEEKERMVLLLNEQLEWDYLLMNAAKHNLKPLLYSNLNSINSEKVPENVLRELGDYFQANMHKNLFFTGELITILEKFKANNIGAIPFKGPTLAVIAYNSLSYREFVDLDIVVGNEDTATVYKIMQSLGYELDSYPKKMDISLYFKTQSEHKFINKDKGIVVEIHNNFQGHFFSFPVDVDFLCDDDNLMGININNHQLNSLSNENLLLMLSVHCARHDWSRLFWLCDINQMIQLHNMDWGELVNTAEKLKVKRILLISLCLAADLFGSKLPEAVINDIIKDPEVKAISKKLKKGLIYGNNDSLNIYERILFDLKKRESLRMGLKDVLRSILKPSYVDFDELPLPGLLFPLYYVIRPFLLIKRYGNKSV